MRTKTAYRKFKDGGRVNPEPPPVEISVAAMDIPGDAPVPGEHEAAAELKAGIDALKRANEHQRHQAAEHAPSLESTLAAWRQAGLPEGEVEFLRQNPKMAHAPELTQAAAHAAMQAGHAIGSEGFHSHMRDRFNYHMGEAQKRAAAVPQEEPVPDDYFKPSPEPQPERDASAYVSAPVSRHVPSGGERSYAADPRQVTLSAEERAVARASGLSELEYARNKIRLQREKLEGLHQK